MYKNDKGKIVKGKSSDDEEDLINDTIDAPIKLCDKCENELDNDEFYKVCDDKSLAIYIRKQNTKKNMVLSLLRLGLS